MGIGSLLGICHHHGESRRDGKTRRRPSNSFRAARLVGEMFALCNKKVMCTAMVDLNFTMVMIWMSSIERKTCLLYLSRYVRTGLLHFYQVFVLLLETDLHCDGVYLPDWNVQG